MDVPEGELRPTVQRLAKLLKVREAKIRQKLEAHTGLAFAQLEEGHGPGGFDLIVVKEDVARGLVSYLLERKQSFPGVEIRKSYLRDYPNGVLAAHLFGNIGEISHEQLKDQRFKGYAAGDRIGQGGLEWTYDRWLRGRDGVAKVEVDAYGRPKARTAAPGGRLPQPGHSLVTTIDARVQAKTEEALQYAITLARKGGHQSANGGAALVLDARNGEVVAMASYPTYDPEVWVGGISTKDYAKLAAPSANRPLLNRAIQSQKAVGSTFKHIVAVAGLEEGVISTSTTSYCDGGYKIPIDTGGTVFGCWNRSGHGTLELNGAVTQSCDVYFYNVGYRFYGRQGTELADWAGRLGMGKVTGIDIPGEVSGRIPTPAWRRSYFKSDVDKIWTPGHSINLSIGQGDLEATPLQLGVTYATIANGGKVVTPHIGRKVVDGQGKLIQDLDPGDARKIDISQGTLDAVRRSLWSAANAPAGTSAPIFAGYPVTVAGKTGTAEVWDNGRYVDYAWYASYAPYQNPRYVTVLMVEKGGHGGAVAAPATRLIYDALFKVKSAKASGHAGSD
jgi:penicillin-binding protein 2